MMECCKIAIIGAGYVGATICYALTLKELVREIVLIDLNTEKARGEALDINHGIPYMGNSIVFQGTYADCKDCNLIIIAAGKNRVPGQSRLDLLEENTKIMKEVSKNIMHYYTGGVILMVSNPVDALTFRMSEWCGLENGRIFGTGCLLDTSRLVTQLASYVNLTNDNVHAMVMGEHGECQMPIWSRVRIGNASIEEYCHMVHLPWDETIKQSIMNQVKGMGEEIIKRKVRTHYGIATGVCYLAETIIRNQGIVVSVSSVLTGEYGIEGVALSVPSIVGRDGVGRRLVEKWSAEEILFLQKCSIKAKKQIQ